MTEQTRILVVDDSLDTLELLRRNLTAFGYQISTATGVAEAIKSLENTDIDLVITDVKMPGANGFDLLRHVRENHKNVEVLLITGFPALEDAIKAIKIGAVEYIVKPFTDEELNKAVKQVLEKLRLRMKMQKDGVSPGRYGLIGDSKPMREVCRDISKAAGISATVLIQGESGTGKEVVARAIHYNSSRAAAPFVPVNCGSIPEQLLESEMFGYVKGAFTGAITARAGFFQTADKGTIFLDEISEASLAMQVKLLRVLQDKELFMLGSSRPRTVDVRIMAATNKDLPKLINKGTFREDLFYRLNVVNINVPPLRDRGDDVILLINHFVAKYAKELGREAPQISDEVLKILRDYTWPGNVRELQNLIQRMITMMDGSFIDVPDLPSHMRFSSPRMDNLELTLAEMEVEYIKKVLSNVNGNKTLAAKILGINRKTLREKLK